MIKLRLMHTTDHGQTWSTVQPPGLLTDLAVDPADDRHLIVIGEHGLIASTDAGSTWRPLALQSDAAHLIWPRRDSLVLVDRSGSVSRSTDGGATSKVVGSLGGPPTGPLAAVGGTLYAVVGHDTIVRSADDGATWAPLLRLAPAA
jgi:photosystem II stability/assembly factor-like uncharacterized protein